MTDQTFELFCTACQYERTVHGLDAALDVGETHTTTTGSDHSVSIYATSYLARLSEDERQEMTGRPARRRTPATPETESATSAGHAGQTEPATLRRTGGYTTAGTGDIASPHDPDD